MFKKKKKKEIILTPKNSYDSINIRLEESTKNDYNQLATNLASNPNQWMLYFRALGNHFVNSFNSNYPKLREWQKMTERKEENNSLNRFDKLIKSWLLTLYGFEVALSPQDNDYLKVDEHMLEEFVQAKKENYNEYEDDFKLLKLMKHLFMHDTINLAEMMNLTLTFYTDFEFRKQVFFKIVSSEPKDIWDFNLYEMFPKEQIKKFWWNKNLVVEDGIRKREKELDGINGEYN